MAVREKLIYAIGLEVDAAKNGLKDFRKSVTEAEGTTAKFKAGASSAFSSVQANIGVFALGAAGALAAFGVKAVGAFTDTAKAAVDLSTSTGLAVEDASRWIAVGDDYKVGADALATGLGKVAKTLDDEKWTKYGIATRDASGNARDVNDILLDSFDTLSKVTNETERARIGQELFGKGYQSLTPLLGHTRAEYEKMLATQQKGQVITEAEAKKAEKTRLALDNLHDTIQELTLAFGQSLAPAVADAANDFAKLVAGAQDLAGAINDIPGIGGTSEHTLTDALIGKGGLPGELGLIKDAAEAVGERFGIVDDKATAAADAFDLVSDGSDRNKGALALQTAEQNKLNAETDKGNAVFSVYAGNVKGAADATDRARKATDRARKANELYVDSLQKERDEVQRQIDTMYDYEQSQVDTAQAVQDLRDTEADSESTLRDIRDAQIASAEAAYDQATAFAESTGASDGSTASYLAQKAELERLKAKFPELAGEIDNYISKLNQIPGVVSTQLLLTSSGRAYTAQLTGATGRIIDAGVPTQPSSSTVGRQKTAKGGIARATPGGIPITVAEAGQDEAIIPLPTNGSMGMGATYNVTINVQQAISPTEVIALIKKHERWAGPGWRT